MIKILRRALALAFGCCLFTTPVQAVVSVTYVFDAVGTGVSSILDAGKPYNPPLNPKNTYFPGLRLVFYVPDASNRALYLMPPTSPGPGILSATTTFLSFSIHGGLGGHGTAEESGNVCFNNPTGLFPTSNVSIVEGGNCGLVDYHYLGHVDSTIFSGKVFGFSVLDGDPYGLAGSGPGYSVFSIDVPEPATWTLMLVGFGAIGCAMRRNVGARSIG